MRFIGAFLVIVSSAGIGIYFSTIVKGRLSDLRDLRRDIFMLRGDIKYARTPMPEAIESIAKRNHDHFLGFFRALSEELKELNGCCFAVIWDRNAKEELKNTYLVQKDYDLIIKLGESLGYMDVDMQVKSIDFFIEQLEEVINELAGTVKEKTRLYNMLGVLAGIFVTIVLI